MKLEDLSKIDTLVQDGGWVGNLRNLPGVRLKVRGEMNTDYQRRAAELYAEVPEQERARPEAVERIETALLHETVLIDWNGIEEPFTPENALQALQSPVFRRAVQIASRAVGEIGAASLEADAKN